MFGLCNEIPRNQEMARNFVKKIGFCLAGEERLNLNKSCPLLLRTYNALGTETKHISITGLFGSGPRSALPTLARQKNGKQFRRQHLADGRARNLNGVTKKLVWLEVFGADPNKASDSSQRPKYW
jgi:hypothetical protein